MARFKRNYLPSQSGPWAKQVEDAIDSTERNLKTVEVNNRSKDEQFSASLSRLDGAVIEARSASELADAAQNTAIAANTAASDANTAASLAIQQVVDLGAVGGPAINASNINAGTLTGVVFRTAASSTRVETTANSINFYGPSNLGGSITGNYGGQNAILIDGNGYLVLDAPNVIINNGLAVTGGNLLANDGNISTINNISGGTINSSGTIITGGSLTRTVLAGGGTTTASINDAGNFIRTSSSQRYKTDIQLLDIDLNDLYAIQPKTFKRIDEVEQSPETARTYPGFIAEELAGTSLDRFVFYSNDEEGNPRPEGIHYAELTGALLIAIKDLNTRIEALEAK